MTRLERSQILVAGQGFYIESRFNVEAELLTYGVNPGVGYRVNEWLSLGVGFSVLHAQLDQKAAVNNSAVPF